MTDRVGTAIGNAAALVCAVISLTLVASLIAPHVRPPILWVACYQIACVAIPVAIFLVIKPAVRAALTRRRPPGWIHGGAVVVGIAIAIANAGLVIPLLYPAWSPQAGPVSGRPALIVSLLVLALLPAVFEELVFRGVVLGALARRHRSVGIILSAALFACFHFSVPQIVPLFVVGLATGIAFVATGNILIPILIHLANNAAILVWIHTLETGPTQLLGTAGLGVSALGLGVIWTTQPRFSKTDSV